MTEVVKILSYDIVWKLLHIPFLDGQYAEDTHGELRFLKNQAMFHRGSQDSIRADEKASRETHSTR